MRDFSFPKILSYIQALKIESTQIDIEIFQNRGRHLSTLQELIKKKLIEIKSDGIIYIVNHDLIYTTLVRWRKTVEKTDVRKETNQLIYLFLLLINIYFIERGKVPPAITFALKRKLPAIHQNKDEGIFFSYIFGVTDISDAIDSYFQQRYKNEFPIDDIPRLMEILKEQKKLAVNRLERLEGEINESIGELSTSSDENIPIPNVLPPLFESTQDSTTATSALRDGGKDLSGLVVFTIIFSMSFVLLAFSFPYANYVGFYNIVYKSAQISLSGIILFSLFKAIKYLFRVIQNNPTI